MHTAKGSTRYMITLSDELRQGLEAIVARQSNTALAPLIRLALAEYVAANQMPTPKPVATPAPKKLTVEEQFMERYTHIVNRLEDGELAPLDAARQTYQLRAEARRAHIVNATNDHHKFPMPVPCKPAIEAWSRANPGKELV